MNHNYQVIEDNGGNMYLFFFDENDEVVLGIENIENCNPDDMDGLTLAEAQEWDSQMEDPAGVYENLTSYEFGWKVVADQSGIYPDKMGRAAERVFNVEK